MAKASQIQLAQPLLTIAWSVPLLGDHLDAAGWLTAVIVGVCVLVTQRTRPKSRQFPIAFTARRGAATTPPVLTLTDTREEPGGRYRRDHARARERIALPPGPSVEEVDRWFEIAARGSTLRTEVLGGLTTFLTLVYIVFVNPAILSATPDLHGVSLPFDQVLAVTALAGGILTIAMGIFGRYPFALAAGLGLNAFAAAEVAAHKVGWSSMMGIFVIDGAVIVALVVLGLRERIIDAIPFDLKLSIGIGIGAFITIVGLKNAGFVIKGGELGTLGAHLGTWKILVFTLGLLVTWTLHQRGVHGALLIGIVGATLAATVINAIDGYHIWTDGTARLPQGAWLTTPDLSLADGSHVAFHFGALGGGAVALILAVVMSDLFDNVGTSVSVARNAGMLDDQGRLPADPNRARPSTASPRCSADSCRRRRTPPSSRATPAWRPAPALVWPRW